MVGVEHAGLVWACDAHLVEVSARHVRMEASLMELPSGLVVAYGEAAAEVARMVLMAPAELGAS